MPLQPGTRLGNYEVLSELGSGGMGEVYKARDLKLGREVAIKVLPQEMSADPSRLRRFQQEARAASALNHPNIVTIYEIGEHNGTPFIAMEYVKGRTLREILADGPLPNDKLIRYATQLAEGLAKAHQAGIVHRDLKPENIIISDDGYVKILDFGLAKLLPEGEVGAELSTLARETTPGAILGTVGYMSPEQAKGQDADFRADQFSLGAILFEMATGKRAFEGGTPAETLSAVLRDEPKLDGAFSEIVGRCLRKSADQRWPSTRELVAAIGKAESLHRRMNVPSVAVLPFSNVSADPEQEYFCDGMTDEIIADLSKIRALRVISRTSIMRLKHTDKDLRTIGHELNVRYLLEGTVRKSANSLRITARLIDAADDVHLWAEKYSGTLEDVFDIQERVSRAIVQALHVTLTHDEARRVAERPIQDVRAYECYLRARHEIWVFTKEGLDRALDLLRRGLDIVGENALLHATLGTAYWQHINAGVGSVEHYLQKAEECAARVFKLEPECAPGHYLRGLIWLTRGNIQEAVKAHKRALALDPDNPEALFMHAALLSAAGKDSTAAAARLLDIDPLTPHNLVVPTWGHMFHGRFSLAEAECRRWLERDQNNPLAALCLGELLARIGSIDEARGVFDQLADRNPNTMFGQLAQFLSHTLRGNKADALAAVNSDLTEAARWDMQYSWEMASGYALIDERDKAIDWLETATHQGMICYPFLSQYDPLLENLRQEPRFKELMEDVRSQWERFEV